MTAVEAAVDMDAVESFRTQFHGQLVQPGDEEYDSARQVWNGMVDKRPAIIARCTGVADVITAVTFAREHDMLTAIRGGGHNAAGLAVCDGGLVIDLSELRSVHVDPERVYFNFDMHEEGEDVKQATFGENHERLVEVKNRYDPENLFRVDHNVSPTVRPES